MRFFEWLVIEEINKKINKEQEIKDKIRNFLTTLSEASETVGFLEKKVILESINYNQKKLNESWKDKLSKLNWNNIKEDYQDEEDIEDNEEVVMDDPFAASDEDVEKALRKADQASIDQEEKNKEKRRKKLKKLKDAMLIIRWNAMNKRAKLIEELRNSSDASRKSQILNQLGYSDSSSDESRALSEKDNEIPAAAESLVDDQSIVNRAKSDIADILYKTSYIRNPFNKKQTIEKQSGIIKKIIEKSAGRSSMDSQEIFGILISKLFEILTKKNKYGQWRSLPEGIGNFEDLETGSDLNTLGGIAAYLVSTVNRIPSEEAQKNARQSRGKKEKKWSNIELGEGVRNPKTKAALVEADRTNKNTSPYIELLSSNNYDKTKTTRSARGTRAEKSQSEKELQLRKAIIRDMLYMKLIKASPIPSSEDVLRSLTEYLAELRKQIISSSYGGVTHMSALAGKDDASSAEDSLEAARQQKYWGSDPEGHDKGSDNEDPADVVANREEENIRSIIALYNSNPNLTPQEIINTLKQKENYVSLSLVTSVINRIKQSKSRVGVSATPSPAGIYGKFKEALEKLLKDPSKRLWGLTFCLAYNLDCSAGFPSTIDGVEKVKKQALFADRLNQMLGRTDITHGMVRQYLMKAKKWIKDNYPELASQLNV